MKKGFTLIELLAVIAILAIILLIAVPYVINTITNVKSTAFVQNEDMMIASAKNYVAANQNLIPTVVGDTIEIKLSTLQAANFVSIIKDPKDSSKICDGYILVTKTQTSFDYTPNLKCDTVYDGYTTDGLVAYYKLDKTSEKMGNELLTNGDMNSYVGSTVSNWNFSNYTGRLAISIINDNGDIGQRITQDVSDLDEAFNMSQTVATVIGKKYRLTYTLKSNLLMEQSTRGNATYILMGATYLTDIDASSTGGIKTTRTYDFTASDVSTTVKFGTDSPNFEIGQYVEIYDISLKEINTLDYTPYKNIGTYYGSTITNNRFNNNDKALSFNGSNYLDLGSPPSLKLNTGGTITAWVYMTSWGGSSWSNTIVGKGGSGWPNHHFILFKYDNTTKLHLSVSDGTNYLAGSGPQTENLTLNTWYYVVASWDANNKCIYINGNESQCVVSTIMPINSVAPVSIGRTGSNGYYFNGTIDDVKIYNRALTATEIKRNYEVEKIASK